MAYGLTLSAGGFKQLLLQNVVEATFIRRHHKVGWKHHRRILCTLDRNFLNSIAGRIALNFRPPVHPPPYPAGKYNLVTVWDLFMQDYRAVPVELLEIQTVIPSHTKPQQDKFWEYFSAYLTTLTPQQKNEFMNY